MAQDTDFTLPCGSFGLDLSVPVVMGILNLTPDSFFDGGKYAATDSALAHAEKMLSEGARILDLGAASTRPGAIQPSLEEEWKRMQAPLETIRKAFPDVVLSIDTWRSEIAKRAVDSGANMINDISGGTMDAQMYATIGQLNVPYVCMHIQGTPETMQVAPHYENVVEEVKTFFREKLSQLEKHDVQNVILDPGFGFGKDLQHNYDLMKALDSFSSFGKPILVGVSRKSMVMRLLDIKKNDALNGTTALNMIALQKGANILRVHDVKEAVECVKIHLMCK